MKVGPKSSLRLFLHRALQLSYLAFSFTTLHRYGVKHCWYSTDINNTAPKCITQCKYTCKNKKLSLLLECMTAVSVFNDFSHGFAVFGAFCCGFAVFATPNVPLNPVYIYNVLIKTLK